jgi:hypothetical protein
LFASWLGIWVGSGHWFERGRHRGGYVMSRPGDRGPYSTENVEIVPHVINAGAAWSGKRRDPVSVARSVATRTAEASSWRANLVAALTLPSYRHNMQRVTAQRPRTAKGQFA